MISTFGLSHIQLTVRDLERSHVMLELNLRAETLPRFTPSEPPEAIGYPLPRKLQVIAEPMPNRQRQHRDRRRPPNIYSFLKLQRTLRADL